MRKILIVILVLFSKSAFSQAKDTLIMAYISVQNYEIEASSIKKYPVVKKDDFEGSYHFGESEGESSLDILYSNNKFYARTEYAEWEDDTWVGKSDRLIVKYKNDKIIIDKIAYELSTHEQIKGMKSNYFDKVDNILKHYIQFNPSRELERPKGEYPETSFVRLYMEDIHSYSKKDLKIMRNEIFARNGYVFRKGGEMDEYFSRKKWYSLMKKTDKVNLSDIEEHNVNLILKLERK